MLFKNRLSKLFSVIFIAFLILLIILFPDISNAGVSSGLLISSNVIIPSLFPFMVCVLMIIKSGFYIKNRVVDNILYFVFGHNFHMFFVFILSMLGGYPVGARLINELYKQKAIDKRTADIMLMYCVNAGPAFIISVVGKGVFASHKIGVVLLLSHITASVIMAVIFSRKLKKINCVYTPQPKVKNFSESFVESVADASASILQICSFVILFSAINSYLDCFFGNMAIIKYVSYFTEVTSAVTKTQNIVFISFLLGFSGLSIWCQIFALSSGRSINIIRFCVSRILHGALSAFLTDIIIKIFDIKISAFSNNMSLENEILYSNTALFFAMVIMLIVLLTFIYTKNNSGKIINDVI